MIKKQQETAIEWHPMLPKPLKGKWRRPDLRNHRKIVVVDGRVCLIGSLNMIDTYYHNRRPWRRRPLGKRYINNVKRPTSALQ